MLWGLFNKRHKLKEDWHLSGPFLCHRPFISFQINNHKNEWKVFHSMTYQVSSLLECEPTPCLNFHHKPDLSGPVSILAITDNAHIWQNRARCAPLMDTARGTLYSVPRIELQVEVCLHMRGLFCIDHCQWNGLRFPNIFSIKVPFFILDSLSGNSSIRWSLAAFCEHFLKKYALCK